MRAAEPKRVHMKSTSQFDPYHKWLGIPPAEQPANHYRLLGLTLFESDPDVIDVATEQRVTYLRQCATGEHVAESQKLLNEIASARLCLLNAEKKRNYDSQLRNTQTDSLNAGSIEPAIRALTADLHKFVMRHTRALAVAGVLLLMAMGFLLSPRGETPSKPESGGETNVAGLAKSLTDQRAGAEWNANGLKMPFRWCPPGTFVMGSPKGAKIHYEDEDPVSVSLSRGFWIGKHEVTQAEWREVMGSSPWEGKENVAEGKRYPAVMISWADATLFCRTLTEQERRAGRLPKDWEYRLPTEAQWEYACRAGTETQYSFGNDDDQLVEHAWFMTNSPSLKSVHEVGRKPPNAWGLFDMHGNVTEWCQDGYFSKLSGGSDPEMVLPSSDRVRRGGSVLSQTTACRSAFRGRDIPTRRWFDLGFRVAIVDVSK